MDERVTRIFLGARELHSRARADFVAHACDGDPALLREVESLLEHDALGALLMPDDRPARALADIAAGALEGLEASVLPARVGKYPILGLLGRGGMGFVYRSEQDHPRRPVALKVLRPDFMGAASLKRFQYEVEVLGRLRHPGIAQIFEAGTCATELGPQPYFAMELVEGCSLLEHARRNGLGLRARLELIASIADAVQYAHQQGVVHRDLKPGNVLVDERGQAKVLDFGIARASDADLQATTLVTQGGQLLGTLPYMSPEQLDGDPREIDSRCDVYALGVTLYELLCGCLPHDVQGLALTDAVVRLRNGEPVRLGLREPGLRGDVETIVHKALAKEKQRRYQTAAELALDLRRFLRDEPILARPAGWLYLCSKFTRRHRVLVASLAGTALAVLAGLGVALVLYRRERDQSERVFSLSAIQRLQGLRESASVLWPDHPYRLADMEQWLARADELVLELPQLERFLADLRTHARPGGAGAFAFRDPDEQWLHDSMARLVTELSVFADPDPQLGLRARVRARLQLAEGLVEETIGAYATEWEACLAALETSEHYGGLVIDPQHGLVPLRADPRSGLWEFWHVRSGERPELDPTVDRWRIQASTGLVLVLLPGGSFRMGAQNLDPALPNWDRNCSADTTPVHEARVAPFFLSRYEMTQAQWQRLAGSNPSLWLHEGTPGWGLHPVEQVDLETLMILMHWGLWLPTEAQWEYAARAGTDTTWFGGDEVFYSLFCFANIKDQSYRRSIDSDDVFVPWDDGFPDHAPVGSFEPNGFGLHDVLGNVREWCADPYGSYELPLQDGHAARAVSDLATERVFRGGGYLDNIAHQTSAARLHWEATRHSPALGVRPMMWVYALE